MLIIAHVGCLCHVAMIMNFEFLVRSDPKIGVLLQLESDSFGDVLPQVGVLLQLKFHTGCPRKKFLIGFGLYLYKNIQFCCSILMDFFLCISGIILNTDPFMVDV